MLNLCVVQCCSIPEFSDITDRVCRFLGSNEWNQDGRTDAQCFLLSMTKFPFIFTLVVTKEVLGYTKALDVKLPGRYVDVVFTFRVV